MRVSQQTLTGEDSNGFLTLPCWQSLVLPISTERSDGCFNGGVYSGCTPASSAFAALTSSAACVSEHQPQPSFSEPGRQPVRGVRKRCWLRRVLQRICSQLPEARGAAVRHV